MNNRPSADKMMLIELMENKFGTLSSERKDKILSCENSDKLKQALRSVVNELESETILAFFD